MGRVPGVLIAGCVLLSVICSVRAEDRVFKSLVQIIFYTPPHFCKN